MLMYLLRSFYLQFACGYDAQVRRADDLDAGRLVFLRAIFRYLKQRRRQLVHGDARRIFLIPELDVPAGILHGRLESAELAIKQLHDLSHCDSPFKL